MKEKEEDDKWCFPWPVTIPSKLYHLWPWLLLLVASFSVGTVEAKEALLILLKVICISYLYIYSCIVLWKRFQYV